MSAGELCLYLQHSSAGEPMRTEKVDARTALIPSLARRRHGGVPTFYEVMHDGKWRRVYREGNLEQRLFICAGKDTITVTEPRP